MVVGKDKTKKEFEELLLEVRKVTRVTTWWRRMSFRATVLVWDKKWKIWLGISKWVDVTSAIKKAANEAYKNIFIVPINKNKSVPYSIVNKYKACMVKILPAAKGTWLKAWSSVRSTLELAWYENILSKIMGSNNKLNNAIATIKALTKYKHAEHFSDLKKEKNDDKKLDNKEIKNIDKKEEIKKDKSINKAPIKKTELKKPITKKTPVKKVETKKAIAKKTTTKKPIKK